MALDVTSYSGVKESKNQGRMFLAINRSKLQSPNNDTLPPSLVFPCNQVGRRLSVIPLLIRLLIRILMRLLIRSLSSC